MPPKRRKQDQEEGSPAWMATFSDLATLLLAFFVLLYSFSILDVKKFELFIASFRGAGILESGTNPIEKTPSDKQQDNSDDSEEIVNKENQELDNEELDSELLEVYTIIKEYLKENELEADVALRYETRGIVLQIKDKVFFDSGKTELKKDSKALLDKLAELFLNIPNEVSIEGHTDNVPTNPQYYATNWELSTDRAVNVVRYFTESKGLPPNRIHAIGYGEFRPLVDNINSHNKSLNRRVAIIVLAKDQYESRVILGD